MVTLARVYKVRDLFTITFDHKKRCGCCASLHSGKLGNVSLSLKKMSLMLYFWWLIGKSCKFKYMHSRLWNERKKGKMPTKIQ